MNVLIVVTHLLGTGHLARALTLARAIRDAGDRATVVSGGMPAPQLDPGDVPLVQLPPVRSDGVNFALLLDETGAKADDALFNARRTMLLDVLAGAEWDVVITELFPFGRRILRAEFATLLDAARAQAHSPLICASIRDILAPPSKPEKADKTHALIDQYYDAVLVHSDPAATPLDVSWPVTDVLRRKLHYTGYVTPAKAVPHPDGLGSGEIVVTAGGGAVGGPIFDAALEAAHGSGQRWRLLVGGHDSAQSIRALAGRASANVTVEPARPEFRQMLNHAAASLSMCGYNTALDVLQSGVPAVFVPFDAGGEVEQTLRANALMTLDGIAVLPSAELSGARVREALGAVQSAPARRTDKMAFDGATQTVRILRDLCGVTT